MPPLSLLFHVQDRCVSDWLCFPALFMFSWKFWCISKPNMDLALRILNILLPVWILQHKNTMSTLIIFNSLSLMLKTESQQMFKHLNEMSFSLLVIPYLLPLCHNPALNTHFYRSFNCSWGTGTGFTSSPVQVHSYLLTGAPTTSSTFLMNPNQDLEGNTPTIYLHLCSSLIYPCIEPTEGDSPFMRLPLMHLSFYWQLLF